MMKLKHFALCAVAAAIIGCDTDTNNNNNTLGSIALSGTALAGETLSTSVNDEDGISGTINYYWYADGQVISGANGSTFTLTDEQIGLAITAQALYTDDSGVNESHLSEPTASVAAIAFASSVTITGDALIGATLVANVSDDNGFDTALVTYKWFADDVEIADEELATFTVTQEQLGKVITVNATFEDSRGFSESATSQATNPVERVNTEGLVVIVGTPTVGNTLEAEITDEDGATGTITYQWFADDEAITNATQSTYVVDESLLGQVITVQVTYTDDNGFAEDNLSEATITVSAEAVDEAGSITILGATPYLITTELTAQISDNNGVDEANITYTWLADGVAIADTNSKTFTPTDQAGATMSVSASYTDNDGFSSIITGEAQSVVYSQLVSEPSALISAVSDSVSGAVIGLNTGVYANLDAIMITSPLTLKAVEGQSPVISGELCIHVANGVDGAGIEGLTFKNIDTKASDFCESEEDAVIYSEGDNFTFTHNTIDGEDETLNNATYHWLMLKGDAALVERNTFANRDKAENGSVIKMSSSSTNHVVQYNLFTGTSSNPNFGNSSLHLINAGSTTGTGSADDANFTIQYNRVENFVTGRRLMRVQTSGATIKGNTILNPNGGISLEDGGFNTVSDNIIIRTTNIDSSSDRPAGVLVTPLGHTVSNNYIAGIRSGNKEAGGIVFTANPFSQADGGVPNGGNQAVLDGAGDLTLNVTNNTVLNSQQPFVFSTEIGSEAPTSDCDELTAENAPVLYDLTKNAFVINFNGNLNANGVGDQTDEDTIESSALTLGYFFPNSLSSDHSFEYDCDLINHSESLFSNSFGFSDSYESGDASDLWVDIRNLNGNGEYDTDGAIDQNPQANGKEVPEFITATSTLLETDSNGAQALAGAKNLYYIQSTDVGAGSTWVAQDE